MTGNIRTLIQLGGARRVAILIVLTLVAAISEGIGFVMLVPLLALFTNMAGTGGLVGNPMGNWLPVAGGPEVLAQLLAGFAVLVTARAVCDYRRQMLGLELSITIVDRLRMRGFSALLDADWRALSAMRQSDNRALLLATMDRVSFAVDSLIQMVRILFGLGALGLAALAISPLAAIAAGAVGVLIWLLYGGLRKRAREQGDALNDSYVAIFAQMEQGLDNLRLIKSFGREDTARRNIGAGLSDMRSVQRAHMRDSSRARMWVQIIAGIVLAGLAWLALARWSVDPIILLPLVALFARAVPQLAALQDSWHNYAHHVPALQAGLTLIHQTEAQRESAAEHLPHGITLSSAITLAGICVEHRAGIPALDHVDLTLGADETLHLSGPSGAGKSTLADVLGGLIAPDRGMMQLDGADLDADQRHSWRQRVAYVQQEPVLFDGSVRTNLLWADGDATEERLLTALHAANAEFALDLPGGLDCLVGDKGHHLSGGEKQRIALARALLRNPDLLILDEATSALDSAAEAEVARAIEALKGQMAILIIGHRGALGALADRSLVIDMGKLSEAERAPTSPIQP